MQSVPDQMGHSPRWLPDQRWEGECWAYCRNYTRPSRTSMRRMLSAGVVLLHDNALPHKAWRLTHLQEFSWEVFNHPPYSLDLTPSDFHLYLHLKKFLSGQHQYFQNDREAEMSVIQWFQSQEAKGYKSWSHGMTNVSILEVNMLENSSTLAVSVPINLPLNWVSFL